MIFKLCAWAVLVLPLAACGGYDNTRKVNSTTPRADTGSQSAPENTPTQTPSTVTVDLTRAVEFADPNFEQIVREVLNLSGRITEADLAEIKNISYLVGQSGQKHLLVFGIENFHLQNGLLSC